MKSPFVGDSGEAFAYSLFRSPRRQSSSGQYDNVTWKIIVKSLFISESWEASAHSLFRSPGRQLIKLIYGVTQRMFLQRPFISETKTSPLRQSISSGYNSLTRKMVTLHFGREWCVLKGLIEETFHFEGILVLKGLIFTNFHFEGGAFEELIFLPLSNLAWSSGPERSDFQ